MTDVEIEVIPPPVVDLNVTTADAMVTVTPPPVINFSVGADECYVPAGGSANQVLSKRTNTDHDVQWAPPGIDTVTVVTANGVGGDGQPATPVIAKHSGLWGAALQLDKFMGTSDLAGLPIYIDSVGNLRAQPGVIFPATAKQVADLPSTYPLGVSVMTLTGVNAIAGGWPNGASSMVITFLRMDSPVESSSSASQIWSRSGSLGNTSVEMMFRAGGNTGWSAWQSFAGAAHPRSASGTAILSLPTAQTGNTVAVTFPAGRFATAPAVAITRNTGVSWNSLPIFYWASGISASGFNLNGVANAIGGAATLTWIAVEES